MSGKQYDVVVIGGGIHGAGVAQAAAAAGHSVLVLEQSGLACATSSRSSKLIHGGLRYLESLRFRLVRESLAERATLLRLAPDLVRLAPFNIPVYSTTTRRPWKIRAGLALYALLGGLKRSARFETLPRRRWNDLDGLDTNNLLTVFRYRDAQTDDAALTRAVMRSAQKHGAELVCPAEFRAARREGGGFAVGFAVGGAEMSCNAATIVNAAGPWANRVLERFTPAPPQLTVELVQGTHILVAGEIREGVYYVEAPRDRRAVFVMPWQGGTLVGTTETPYRGDPAAVRPLPAEIEYLQETLLHYFPRHGAVVRDSFAGLRVLPRGDGALFHRSRETVLHPDTARAPRLITIYGGKLTGYRLTAARVMRMLRRTLPPRRAVADTEILPLRD